MLASVHNVLSFDIFISKFKMKLLSVLYKNIDLYTIFIFNIIFSCAGIVLKIQKINKIMLKRHKFSIS